MLNQKFKVSLSSLSLSLLISNPLYAAVVFEASTVPYYSIAPHAVSNSDVSDSTSKAYRPWFENGTWQGDIIQYDISSAGDLDTTVDSSVQPPADKAGSDGHNWSARMKFDAAVTANPTTYWNTGREIIFHDGSIQKAFRFDNLSDAQKTALTSNNLDYIRGDQSRETDKTNGTLRKRYNLLGDIIHSNPVYVAAPDSRFTGLPGYSAFKTAQTSRAARIYVGANDGMLHAFNATTSADAGKEEWAYVPSMLINNLRTLTQWPSSHSYMVDGQLAEGDMDFDNNADTYSWRSILAGGLGSGGKGFFILDITNPSVSAEESTADADKKILYEFDGNDSDMGYIYGKAQIVRLPLDFHTDEWAVVTGNGYGSTSGQAKLLMYDKDGNVSKMSTDGSTGNGLSAPTLVDVGNDYDVDIAYAGDLKGNLWKFNLASNDTAGTLLYPSVANANADKPITSAPEVRRHPNGGYLVYFATGSLLSSSDSTNTSTQSVYAIWDGAPDANTTILTQTLGTASHSYVDNKGTLDDDTDDETITTDVRTSSNTVIDWAVHKGWQVDLNISGERVVTTPIIRADRLQFVSHNPLTGDRGDAWYLQLNYLNGGTGAGAFMDLNQDGSLNDSDKVSGNIPVGINLGNGSFSNPNIVRVSNSRDTTFINGLFLALFEGCTENCTDGFQAGHVDVDTDTPSGVVKATPVSDSYCFEDGNRTAGIPVDTDGNALVSPFTGAVERPGGTISTYVSDSGNDGYGGESDGHVHEYDKDHGQVYVDAVNLEPLCEQTNPSTGRSNTRQDLGRVTEAQIDYSKQFFAIIANADLSSGSNFTIGAKTYNVMVYQKMIQQRINAWKSAGTNTSLDTGVSNSFASMMVDDDGHTLLYSITSMLAAGSGTGTLRHAFNDRALTDGGLMANTPGCTAKAAEENISTGADTVDTGRWRGGSLVTQLIGVTEYLADTTTIVEQTPTDLTEMRTIDGVDVYLQEDALDATVSPAVAGTDGTNEIYGGLYARYRVSGTITANPAFLYEIILYWHYEREDDTPCYGDPRYTARVAEVIGSSSTEALQGQLTQAQADLLDAQAALDAGGLSSRRERRLRRTIARLTQEIAELTAGLSDSSVGNTGQPTPPTDVDLNISPSLGPNFKTGRRTWIDL